MKCNAILQYSQALRCAQSIINDGNRFCIDLDLEQFFDNVNHSKLIEVES